MDDYQSRMILIQKYHEIDQKRNAAIDELNQEKQRNFELTSELLELEKLVFQQKIETKDVSIMPQDNLLDFVKHTNADDINPLKLQMEYFKKVVDLTSDITERITQDYKLNPENSLDILISEIDTLKLSLLELNGVKEGYNEKYISLKNEEVKLCKQFGQEVADYNYILDENKFALETYTNKLEHLQTECQSKENELAGLTSHLNKLSSDAIEVQRELLNKNSEDS